jgi:hypothetical protein
MRHCCFFAFLALRVAHRPDVLPNDSFVASLGAGAACNNKMEFHPYTVSEKLTLE